jgi:RNA polymerase sigma-70 factor (ECF subfamily)
MSAEHSKKELRSDAELVMETLQGNTQAYGSLVRAYSSRVYSIAYCVLSDFQAAQDIAQEAFVRAYSSLSQLKDAGKFGTWMDSIARNLARRALQRRKRGGEALTDFSDTAFHPPVQDKDTQELTEALGALPDSYREPLVMRYMGGASYEEIAERLGITRNTAEVRVHRAKKILRDSLVEAGKRK